MVSEVCVHISLSNVQQVGTFRMQHLDQFADFFIRCASDSVVADGFYFMRRPPNTSNANRHCLGPKAVSDVVVD